MKSHHKLYAAVLFLACFLHYTMVCALSSKLSDSKIVWLCGIVASASYYVWNMSGFSQDDK